MRKLSLFCAAAFATAAVLLGFHAAASGEDHHAAPAVRVQGEVLDLACWIAHEAKGPDHAGCAVKCLKGGQPMGLMTKDGKVYLLLADHDDASAYDEAKGLGGKNVEVEGPVAERGGMHGITVKAVKPL